MNNKLKIILSVIMLIICASSNFAQTKLAQSGLKFLSIGGSARATSLADAITSLEGNSDNVFYNPASIARQKNEIDITFSNTRWIADINYINAAITYAPQDALYGVFGISIASVDYGDFHKTIPGPDGGSLDIGIYKPTAMALGLTYSRALSDKFSVGGNLRYIYQDFGSQVVGGDYSKYETQSIDISVVAFDFGIIYKTGYKSLNFGMSIRNFSQEIAYFEENFQLPLSFKLGLSMNLLDLLEVPAETHSLLFSVDAEHPRDNVEMLRVGAEYTFKKTFSLRTGYLSHSDIGQLSYGVGVNAITTGIMDYSVDYSYTPRSIFRDTHRFTVRIALF